MNKHPYTLITGASEGLGKSLAIECASRNMNLVLVALPGSELLQVRDYVSRNFNVDVLAIEQDLTEPDSADCILEKVLQHGININMLINNAGLGNTQLFETAERRFFEKQIRVNVLATTSMTHAFLPMLRQHEKSYVLNVSSLACFFAIPRKQVYGGTKSFIYFFSRSLAAELAEYGVSVSVLCPGGINSNPVQTMLNKSGSWISLLSLMNPEDVAPIAISGLLRGKAVIIPGRLNRLFKTMEQVTPSFLKKRIIRKQIEQLKVYYQPA
ncbi:MAG: SDR family NAD(P)-dependent oxidoreductase [Chitinophagaceae bacterium]|nr:MAG: SDR family NAD(P)-dependent oxidoreductase [Chitinophagaceae bacterium]